MINFVFYAPCIPSNTGNAIRLSAVTGATLHLIKPLGFEMTDSKLKRSGLDYHDLADLIIHNNFDDFLDTVDKKNRIIAFTTQSSKTFSNVHYKLNDYLLFGPEPDGLPENIKHNKQVAFEVRIPMLPARRSLNLANSAAIAVYEAWRQFNYVQGV
jgi:tRNA (cytidine/uridine-2'-O-)-methyltransferase